MDAVINNKIRFDVALPPTPIDMSDDEWNARLELAACYRMVGMYGWTSVVYNHITLRILGTEVVSTKYPKGDVVIDN